MRQYEDGIGTSGEMLNRGTFEELKMEAVVCPPEIGDTAYVRENKEFYIWTGREYLLLREGRW